MTTNKPKKSKNQQQKNTVSIKTSRRNRWNPHCLLVSLLPPL